MGEVVALIRLMPDGVLEDTEIEEIEKSIREKVTSPTKLERVEVKNLAFGLRGFDVTVAVPDDAGGIDSVVEILGTVEKITNVELVDMGRI